MRDSDWSRPIFLRSDWLGLIGAIMTTVVVCRKKETLHGYLLRKTLCLTV